MSLIPGDSCLERAKGDLIQAALRPLEDLPPMDVGLRHSVLANSRAQISPSKLGSATSVWPRHLPALPVGGGFAVKPLLINVSTLPTIAAVVALKFRGTTAARGRIAYPYPV